MAKRRRTISVSWHKASGQFVKWIGKSFGKDGKLRPRVFYLGSDEAVAIGNAVSLQTQWRSLQASGAKAWPPDERPTAPSSVAEQATIPADLRQPCPTPSAQGTLTVGEAARQFLESIRLRRDSQQVGHHYFEGMRLRVTRGISYIGEHKPLSLIGEDELLAMVLTVARRPLVRDMTRPERPMSIVYCRKVVGATKTFFAWCYETGRWNNRPRRFDKLFRFKPVLTVQERAAILSGVSSEPPHFTIEELTKLYAATCDRQRLWFLLCLNCGFCLAELDSLRRFEVKGLDSDQPYIERFRQKTSVYARWALWPETASMARKHMAAANAEDLALLTERGQRLKEVRKIGLTNALWQAWRNIAARSGVDRGSPKLLRKTGAWMTKEIGGLEASEMYLAHQEPGMNKAYAGRRWDKLDAALAEMRLRLKPMFDEGGHCGDQRFNQRLFNESHMLLPFPPPRFPKVIRDS